MAEKSCPEKSCPDDSAALAAARGLGDSWSSTDFPAFRTSHRWTINKFPTIFRAGNRLSSNPFQVGSADWHLELEPLNDRGAGGATWLRILLVLDKTSVNPMTVEWRLSCVSQRREPDDTKTGFHSSVVSTPWSSVTVLNNPYDSQYARANDASVDCTLTILCELTVSFLSSIRTVPSAKQPVARDSLERDLGSLLQSGELSDITLVAEGREFPAHWVILSARSPVFKAMLRHDMREKTESRMEIEDLSADTVKAMLQWMYTGQLPSTEHESRYLLCAADKYNLEPLKLACERSLRLALSVKNAADLLELAELHRTDSLKSDCVIFIAANSKEVKATEGWKRLERERVDLLAQLAVMLLDMLANCACTNTG